MATAESTATKKILDFTNVKESSGINPVHRPAGDYRMKVTGVTEQPNKKDPSVTNWVFTFTPTDMLSATYPYYCVLQENQLWKVRNLLIACGINVPKKRLNVDPNKLVGKEVGVTLDDDEYDGKMKSVINAIFPASDLDDSDTPADSDDEVEDEGDDEVADEQQPEAGDDADVSDEELEELDVEDI